MRGPQDHTSTPSSTLAFMPRRRETTRRPRSVSVLASCDGTSAFAPLTKSAFVPLLAAADILAAVASPYSASKDYMW